MSYLFPNAATELPRSPGHQCVFRSAVQIPQPMRSEILHFHLTARGWVGWMAMPSPAASKEQARSPSVPCQQCSPPGRPGVPAAPRTAAARSNPNQSLSIPWERKLLTSFERLRHCEPCIYISLPSPSETRVPTLLCYQ